MKQFAVSIILVVIANVSLADDVRLLGDFETEEALNGWARTTGLQAELSNEPNAVASGKQAVKLSYPVSTEGYPGLHAEAKPLVGDWTGFDVLKADIFNPTDAIVTLTMRLNDAQTTKWFTASYVELTLRAGKNAIEVPLASLRTADDVQPRPLDLAKMRSFSFFRANPKQPVVLYLDNVRLEKISGATVTVNGLHVLDFGPANSPLWPGATRVTAINGYDPKSGFGWLDKEGFHDGNDGAPDSLAGDWVGGSHYGPFQHTLRVDLPDGEFGVAWIARPPTPVRTFGVRSGSATLFEAIITPQTAPTTKHLFAGMLREYAPNQDAFAKYIDPELPVRVGTANATDGHLDITFDSCNAHFLAVWPAASNPDAEQWLKTLHEARRKEFFSKHYLLNLPKQTNKPEGWPAADRKRGFVAFTRPLHKPIHPNTIPAPSERAEDLTLNVPWFGSDTASFAIHSFEDLAGVQVSISDLGWGMGLWPKEGYELREVRYLERQGPKGVFTPTPSYLVPVRPITDMPRGFTRQYVLVVRNPIRSYTPYNADITIKADGRPPLTVRVTVHVLPIELPPAEDFTVSYYYSNPWSDGLNYRYSLTNDREGARAMLRSELADLRAHGCNSLSLSFPNATVRRTKEGKVEVKLDFAQLAQEYQALKQASFDLRQEFLISPLQFANYRLGARRKDGLLKEFSPEFNAAYIDGLTQVQQWADERGLKLLWWLVDEPREQMVQDWNRNLADTMKYLQLARQVPNLHTTVTPMGDENNGVDYLPMIPLMDVLQTHPWAGSKKQIAMAKANPKQKLWFYNAGIGRFVFGFYPWAQGARGYWQWHYQWRERPFDIFTEGEGAVFPSPDGPLATLGYELSREGINDYRYVSYLESLIANAGGNTTAAEAKSFLDKIRKQIPEWPESGLITGSEAGGAGPTAVDDKLEEWRQQIIRYIVQLRPRKD